MTLENLLKTGQLKSHEPDRGEIQRIHAVALQSLPKTLGVDAGRVAVLDALRRKRNLSDYTGEEIDEGSVKACRAEASKLLEEVAAWLKKNRPELAP